MKPKIIYLMRHCDEPVIDNDCCSDKGCERAKALIPIFNKLLHGKSPQLLLAPGFGLLCGHPSQRSTEILLPLSEYYKLPILTKYCPDQYKEQANNILSLSSKISPIIIGWRKEQLPPLIANLLNYCNPPNLPPYPSGRFDLIYKVTIFDTESKLEVFTQNVFDDDKEQLPVDLQVFQQYNDIVFRRCSDCNNKSCDSDKRILSQYTVAKTKCICSLGNNDSRHLEDFNGVCANTIKIAK